MPQEIYIEVSDLHAEMMDEVKADAGEQQVRQQAETFIHNLYQQVQVQKEQQQEQFVVEEPEEREGE
jgi:hypothetical protein